MTEPVKITPLHEIGKDDRGSTATFSLPRTQSQFISIFRRAGSISGNTYHEGKNPGTNPKIFVLLQGTIHFSYRHKDEPNAQEITLANPSVIEITPFVTHQVEALSDILILECNSIDDIQKDRCKLAVTSSQR